MKNYLKIISAAIPAMVVILVFAGLAHDQVRSGGPAPVFSLKDINGKPYHLAEMKSYPMIVLYFFDADSRPSQEGLLSLDQLSKKYAHAKLIVWGITRSPKKNVLNFVNKTRLKFPVLIDESDVSDLYQARVILPTVYIIGPRLKVLDQIQGGGKSTEIMLVRLAQKKLQQKQIELAKALSNEVIKKDPQNLEANMVKAYADIKNGNLDQAERIFQKMAQRPGEAQKIGLEGLTAVYAKKGNTKKALQLAKEVEKIAPERGYVNAIAAGIHYRNKRFSEAEQESQKAVKKTAATPYQKSFALNQFAQLQSKKGKYQSARKHFDQAIEINPYYIEATANKGSTFEKEGKWSKALEAYRQVLAVDRNDIYASVLAKRAQARLAVQNDAAKKKRYDKLVKTLAERYRSQKKIGRKEADSWTSRPMIMTFVDFLEKGGLAERDGFSIVLINQLTELINSSGRIKVVERMVVERLLEELNLGTSDLANPDTTLKLGKVLAAQIIGTGSLLYLPNSTLLSMRLIESETSYISKVVTRQFGPGISLEKEIHTLNREILKTIIQTYPLRGFIVQMTADKALINLGSNQGVVLGTQFEVVKEQKPIEYKGRVLKSAPKAIAQLEVTQVEPDLCYARILKKQESIQRDDKVQEKITEM